MKDESLDALQVVVSSRFRIELERSQFFVRTWYLVKVFFCFEGMNNRVCAKLAQLIQPFS